MIENGNKSDPESICRAILTALQMLLVWKWDSRFLTFLAEFDVDHKEKIRRVVERYLNNVWDRSNIEKAPNTVQVVNRDLGGLMPGQLLFTSDPEQESFAFCAWWPWGNGKTISLRIGPSYKKIFDSERNRQINKLREHLRV